MCSFLTKRVITSKSVQLKNNSTPMYRHHLALGAGGPGHIKIQQVQTFEKVANHDDDDMK